MPMVDEKLADPANFGAAGRVTSRVTMVQITQPITLAKLDAAACDIFHIGLDEGDARSGTTFSTLSPADVQAVRRWSVLDHTNVVVVFQGYVTAWGNYEAIPGATNPMNATTIGRAVAVHGPFGHVSTGFSQGGAWQGSLVPSASDAYCTIIEDSSPVRKPVAVVDVGTGDILFSDVDILSVLGGVSNTSQFSTTSDIILGNLYALMINIVRNAPPDVCKCEACGVPAPTGGPHDHHDGKRSESVESTADVTYRYLFAGAGALVIVLIVALIFVRHRRGRAEGPTSW